MFLLSIYDHRSGDKDCDIEVEESDTFSVLKEKIEEEKGVDAEDQTLFLSLDTAASLPEVLELRLDDNVLDKWLVRDFQECRCLC